MDGSALSSKVLASFDHPMQAIEHEVRLQLSTENEDVRILLLSGLERHINFKSILGS